MTKPAFNRDGILSPAERVAGERIIRRVNGRYVVEVGYGQA